MTILIRSIALVSKNLCEIGISGRSAEAGYVRGLLIDPDLTVSEPFVKQDVPGLVFLEVESNPEFTLSPERLLQRLEGKPMISIMFFGTNN